MPNELQRQQISPKTAFSLGGHAANSFSLLKVECRETKYKHSKESETFSNVKGEKKKQKSLLLKSTDKIYCKLLIAISYERCKQKKVFLYDLDKKNF